MKSKASGFASSGQDSRARYSSNGVDNLILVDALTLPVPLDDSRHGPLLLSRRRAIHNGPCRLSLYLLNRELFQAVETHDLRPPVMLVTLVSD